jgi:hypothetical protein
MMIKCQKCGFENQMGSIFCRECGEKLDMDAIDPNKLQKDVNKEKNIKRAKKRIKEAISTGIGLLVVAAFIGVVFYNGGLRKYEEPEVAEAVAKQKFNAATNGSSVGKVKYTYPEVNRMVKTMIVEPLAAQDSFAKVTDAEIVYDEEKQEPVFYLWISLKDKVPVIYTIHGNLIYNPPAASSEEADPDPFTLDVKRLDIGRLPLFVSTHSFLNGFSPLLQNEAIYSFFQRAQSVEFGPDGMTVEFKKGGPTSSYTPPTSNMPSSATAAAALKGGSAAAAEKDEAARQRAEEKKRKAEEEKEKQKQLEEERKRKAEEYRQQQKEKEEERKRKAEEEKARKQQEKEERERQIREENERRRQEREDRRRDRQNNNYNNNRSSRSSRNRY